MLPRLNAVILALCACAAAAQQAGTPYEEPESEWRLEPPRQHATEPEPPPAAQPVAALPESVTPPPVPQVTGPESTPDEPDAPMPNGRRLRMDPTFSAFEAITPSPPMTPTGDTSAPPPPAPDLEGEPTPREDEQ